MKKIYFFILSCVFFFSFSAVSAESYSFNAWGLHESQVKVGAVEKRAFVLTTDSGPVGIYLWPATASDTEKLEYNLHSVGSDSDFNGNNVAKIGVNNSRTGNITEIRITFSADGTVQVKRSENLLASTYAIKPQSKRYQESLLTFEKQVTSYLPVSRKKSSFNGFEVTINNKEIISFRFPKEWELKAYKDKFLTLNLSGGNVWQVENQYFDMIFLLPFLEEGKVRFYSYGVETNGQLVQLEMNVNALIFNLFEGCTKNYLGSNYETDLLLITASRGEKGFLTCHGNFSDGDFIFLSDEKLGTIYFDPISQIFWGKPGKIQITHWQIDFINKSILAYISEKRALSFQFNNSTEYKILKIE